MLYTIRYVNATADRVSITIKDKIPEHTTYVENSSDNNGVYADGEVNWNLNLDAWEEVTVSFKVTAVDEGAEIVNEATILEGNNTYTTNEVVVTTKETENTEPTPTPTPEPTPVATPEPTPVATPEPTPVTTPDPTPTPITEPTPTPTPTPDDGVVYKEYTFTKVWNDNNNAAGKRPDSIIVKAYQSGVFVTDIVLSEANGWTSKAILMAQNGDVVYEWTVKEENVPAGYFATYNQETLTITNTYGKAPTGQLDDMPVTGDDSNIGLWIALAVLAAGCLAVAIILGKRTGHRNKRNPENM